MNGQQQQQVLVGAQSYGLSLMPDNRLSEKSQPQRDTQVIERWQTKLEQLDIRILGIRAVPAYPVSLQVDAMEWRLSPLTEGAYAVPPSVYHRVRAAEAWEIPFVHWLWAEEVPAVQPFEGGAVPLIDSFGTSVQRQVSRDLVAAAGRSVVQALRTIPKILLDPLLIGVIETESNRGIWCLVGAWLHEVDAEENRR